MISANENNLFVKGFAQSSHYDHLMNPDDFKGEFVAIITDLVTSSYIKVTAASQKNGKWFLTCSDGETRMFNQEPTKPREIVYCQLVKNYTRNFLGDVYDIVFPNEYEQASKDISNGSINYNLLGYVEHNHIATSSLVKFWTDPSGKNHGITKSGSHYIF